MTVDQIADCEIIKAWRRDDCYGCFAMLSTDLNTALSSRPIQDWPAECSKICDELDELFRYNSLGSKTVLYRACSADTILQLTRDGLMTYPAYISTTTSQSTANLFLNRIPADREPHFLHIHCPANLQFIDIQSREYSGIGEDERLLPRGLKLALRQDDSPTFGYPRELHVNVSFHDLAAGCTP